MCMLPATEAESFSDGVVMLCTSGFVNDVMFSHNGPMARQYTVCS